MLEEAHLLQYLEILQISKANKSTDVYFNTEDAAQFFVNKHIEIRGKPIPFIRKAKRILRVTINGIHPDLADEELRSELYEYVADVSSIRHPGQNYKGMVLKDGSRQLYVTNLTQHIPRSLKIGNRWCLVFYRDQPVLQRKPPQIPTIQITPPPPHLRRTSHCPNGVGEARAGHQRRQYVQRRPRKFWRATEDKCRRAHA